MTQHLLRVKRDPAPPAASLPQDVWLGRRTFIEADGTECTVVASGKMPSPDRPSWLTGPSSVLENTWLRPGHRR